MRLVFVASFFLGSLAGSCFAADELTFASDTDAERAKKIVERVDQIMRGESSIGEMAMEIQSKHWKRTIETKVWSKGTDRALILVRRPVKEAGTATLKAEANIWNYLPKVERVIKVPTSMMMGSWMGSHFTNDDLVKESQMVRDYVIEITYEGPRNGTDVYEFTLTAKPDAPVVWGRIVLEVRKDDLMPTWQHYFDEDGELVRELTFGDYKEMGGRMIPARMEMKPTGRPGEYTRVTYDDLQFDVPLEDDFFSLRRLRNLKP